MIRFLQKDRSKKIFAGIVVVPLIVAMVMYLGDYFTNPGAVDASGLYANVAGEQITSQQVADLANRQGQQRFPNGMPDMFRQYFQRQAADSLVTQAVLVAEAKRLGLKVTDEELREELKKGQLGTVLFPNGTFIGQDAYLTWVQNNTRMSVADFEKTIKQGVLIQKLISVVQGGVSVADSEVEKEFQRQNVKVKFDYAYLTAEDLMKKVPLTETELKAYFDRNKAQFESVIPEQRKAKYVIVDPASVQVTITEDDLKRAYSQRQDQYREPEQVDVRHILVKTEAEAQDVKKKLEAGANFTDLAKKVSEDPGSKDNGGLYQDVVKGQMVPEFDKEAFSLPIGKISNPVKTSFGYHVLKVDARRDARLKPMDQVRAELEPVVRAEKAHDRLEALANTVLNDARRDGIDAAAAKSGLKVVTTDYFNQNSALPGAGNAPAFMQELFTLRAQAPPERVALGESHAVVQVTEVKASSRLAPSFEEARARVEQMYRNERALAMLNARTQELADRARAMNNLRAAAKDMGATVKSSELVAPSGAVPELGSMAGPANVAFNLQPGQMSDAIVSGRNGAVLQLTQRQDPSPAELEQKREEIRAALVQQKRMQMLEAYFESARTRMMKAGDIRINAAEEKRLFGSTGS